MFKPALLWIPEVLAVFPPVMKSIVSLQEPAKLLDSDQMPIYVLSIQERAQQLASQLEGKPVRPEVNVNLSALEMQLFWRWNHLFFSGFSSLCFKQERDDEVLIIIVHELRRTDRGHLWKKYISNISTLILLFLTFKSFFTISELFCTPDTLKGHMTQTLLIQKLSIICHGDPTDWIRSQLWNKLIKVAQIWWIALQDLYFTALLRSMKDLVSLIPVRRLSTVIIEFSFVIFKWFRPLCLKKDVTNISEWTGLTLISAVNR